MSRKGMKKIRNAMAHRCFLGSGIGNPRYMELIVKAHVIIEKGTCDLKTVASKEGK